MKHWIRITAAAALAAAAAFPAAAITPPQYTLTVLGTFGRPQSSATGISESGIVVGNTYDMITTAQGQFITNWVPFMVDHGTATLLPVPADLDAASVSGVNNSGRAAGRGFDIADTGNGPTAVQTSLRAIATQGGALTELGGVRSQASAINNAGLMVGRSRFGTSNHAASFIGGQVIDLGILPGAFSSAANAVNDAGDAVGFSSRTGGLQMATLFSQGQVIALGSDIWPSSALGMNNHGQAVGWAETDSGTGEVQAALFANGQVTMLGTLGGLNFAQAYDINNNGWIVGIAVYDDRLENIPFLRIDGGLVDLNTLITPQSKGDWLLSDAVAINDAGQIAGSVIRDGVRYAALLTPVPELPTPALLALGLALLGARARRLRRH